MSYNIDIYENISISEMQNILNNIRNVVMGKAESKIRLEIPKGFYLLLKHFIKHKNVLYPIEMSIPSDIEDIPVICIDDQKIILVDDNQVLYQQNLINYRTRLNQIYLSIKKLSPIENRYIEEYLISIGFKFHLRMNENQFIASVDNIEVAKKNNEKFQIMEINDKILS